ncbi:MAG: aldehyde dehydrogenase family protein [Planctomycetota bacterium]|nr:aldehyde dehydrogenase family protein [Planctomycetota bacterium]
MTTRPILLDGAWREARASRTFQAHAPSTGAALEPAFPTSRWEDVDEALSAATCAFEGMRAAGPDAVAAFLEGYADRIEANAAPITEAAHRETALPLEPRLRSGELPRTCGQLRQAAAAARSADWTRPIIDTVAGIRTQYGAVGPVAVFGPNNFPLAFGSASGGDFAAAIAAGNPVIAKAHPLHPETTRLLAEQAVLAAADAGLPAATVQLLYDMAPEDGLRFARDPRLAAIGFTGSRRGGLALKAAADEAGTPIHLELGSINPVVMLAGALAERGEDLAAELTGSCLMGTGQFCTNPGLVIVPAGEAGEAFAASVARRFDEAPAGVLFSEGGREGLAHSISRLVDAGAEVLTGGAAVADTPCSYANTVLRATAREFIDGGDAMQDEAFGNATLIITSSSTDETVELARSLAGNLTGAIYSATDGADDEDHDRVAAALRTRVGRLLNDQMPTGVAVSPAMNHGGPFPATANAGQTAVGIPGSLLRFAMLQCYDQVRPHRLPEGLGDENPRGTWRCVDGAWTQGPVPAKDA